MRPDGSSVEGEAVWEAHYILGGWAIQDVWTVETPEGEAFYGTNIRSFDPERKKWNNRWLPSGSLEWKHFDSEQVGDTMVMIGGEGEDPNGSYVDRNTFYNISENHFDWKKDRSYDGGETWIEGVALISADRIRASAQGSWTQEQREVIAAIDRLSAATAVGGGGADAYAAVLSDEFTRWTVGSTVVNEKRDWVAGLREWLDDGWRVADRQTEILEILVRGDYVFTRRIVEETYVGPENERTGSQAALAEVWVRGNGDWLLFRVNVHPLDSR